MREIKFRVWDRIHKLMFYPNLYGFEEIGVTELKEGEWDANCDWMQFTGIIDRDKKKLYEFDIITSNFDTHKDYWIVKFGVYETRIYDEDIMQSEIHNHIGWYIENDRGDKYSLGECENIAIMGDIYQNPGLLKII